MILTSMPAGHFLQQVTGNSHMMRLAGQLNVLLHLQFFNVITATRFWQLLIDIMDYYKNNIYFLILSACLLEILLFNSTE